MGLTDSPFYHLKMKKQVETSMSFFPSHPFAPFYDQDSEILILGSFPSPVSRQEGFYYGHKQNRFWKILAGIFKENIPQTIEEKKTFLTKHRIALYDAIESLEIQGAADSSIQNAKPTDLSNILKKSKIHVVLCNGKSAYRHYMENKKDNLPVVSLPSSSSANASYSLEKLVCLWGELFKDC